jgi:DNA-binding response OmpR family regulator
VLIAIRNGRTIQSTRSERALLRALARNPHRLMRRGRLLDEIASETDIFDPGFYTCYGMFCLTSER